MNVAAREQCSVAYLGWSCECSNHVDNIMICYLLYHLFHLFVMGNQCVTSQVPDIAVYLGDERLKSFLKLPTRP